MNSSPNAPWKEGRERSERWKETLDKRFLPRVAEGDVILINAFILNFRKKLLVSNEIPGYDFSLSVMSRKKRDIN